ncbi:MAG: M1 family metallopeptidase [Nocardioidaceae bacterium]
MRPFPRTAAVLAVALAWSVGSSAAGSVGTVPRPAALTVAATAASPGSPGSGDSLFPSVGNGGYDVGHYSIGLRWFRDGHLNARTTVTAAATQDLSAFDLDLEGLQVTRVVVDGVPASYERHGHELVITPGHSIANGQHFVTTVRYHGTPQQHTDPDGSPDGWLGTRDGATVLAEPVGAMTWFPDNNTPRDKATYAFTVTAPSDLTVESNGRLESKTSLAHATRWAWRESDQMATYLASVSIGRYRVVRSHTAGGIPIVSYIDPRLGDAGGAVSRVPVVLDHWEDVFGPYPFTSAGIVIDDVNVGYALEVQTRPVFPYSPGMPTLVHELAHQWFGDSVTPRDWSDIWLNEGFATYAEWLWESRRRPGAPERHFQELYSSHGANDPFWRPPVAEPPNGAALFGDAVYTRGAMALQALRHAMGGPAFFTLLHRWPSLHREGNANTLDLRRLAERLSGKQLGAVFRDWLHSSTKPPVPYS